MRINLIIIIAITWILTGCGGGSTGSTSNTTLNTTPNVTVPTSLSTLSLLAGNPYSSGNLDGTGAAASFNNPYGITTDNSGNLYVADSVTNTIRKIVISTGAVTTLAGTAGVIGSTDATGASASFNYPLGMAADNAGNLYVADSGNNTIRKIVISTGAVTTLAGTAGVIGSTDATGASASFNNPTGIITDNAGNLYVADTYNNTIRKIVISTGTVTTLAGTAGVTGSTNATGAAASFNGPVAITIGRSGNLWVVDKNNNEIREIVISNLQVTTKVTSLNGPNGITTDNAGNLYVADSYNNIIRKIVISTGVVTTLAGTGGVGSTDATGASASFNYPTGITADTAGNLYVADSNNNTIRKIVISTGAVTTLAGTAGVGSTDATGAAASFDNPQGITTDNAGNLYVADTYNNTIRKIVISTGAVTTLAGTAGVTGSTDATGASASFSSPGGITTDNAGNLYVADSGNNTIRKIVISTGAVTTLAGTAGVTGSTDATGASASFIYPTGITADMAGNLYVADSGNNTIRKIVISTGAVTTLAGTAGAQGNTDATGASASFIYPTGITADMAGNLYVADSGNNTIRKIVISTGAVTTLAGTAGVQGSTDATGVSASFKFPYGITADNSGNLYVTDSNNNTIRKIVISTGAVTTIAGHPNRVGFIGGNLPGYLPLVNFIVWEGSSLYFTDNNAILEITNVP